MIRSFLTKRQMLWRFPVSNHPRCCLNSEAPPELTRGEKKLIDVLRVKFPGATSVQVADISGGCGAMYQISIEASEFQGKTTLQQQRMVNKALSEEIKEMHGLQLKTKPSNTS
ncbi:bolA-like protein 3 [Haliotis cracherodii]|uniref:bolA-like protein 3 n=1 Tax=Haliotis cracherodii TaxID=6455 RepID=UPI0039EA79E3